MTTINPKEEKQVYWNIIYFLILVLSIAFLSTFCTACQEKDRDNEEILVEDVGHIISDSLKEESHHVEKVTAPKSTRHKDARKNK